MNPKITALLVNFLYFSDEMSDATWIHTMVDISFIISPNFVSGVPFVSAAKSIEIYMKILTGEG